MHSAHRDLETKYKRCRQDLQLAISDKDMFSNTLNVRNDEITQLKTKQADLESKLASNRERIDTMQRDIQFKVDQLRDFDTRFTKAQDELDMTKYKC